MFKYVYDTHYSDYRDFDTIKKSTLLEVIQEIAIRHSEKSGYSVDTLRNMDRAWLLQGINVKFEKNAVTHAPIEAYTAVKSLRGVLSERGSILLQNGEVIAKSIANWCLLDTKKMRLARIPSEMINAYCHSDFDSDEFFSYVRPDVIEDAQELYKIRVCNKELDTNKHLNNKKGAELLMDALPFEFEIGSMKVHYPNPAYLGQELSVCVKEIERGYYVHLKNDENTICVVGTFEK